MDLLAAPQFLGAAVVGMVTGLAMLWRGFGGYRTATRIADTGTSSIASMAAGEVRLSGVIEPAEVTLVSPLQSEPCVYYRATIDSDGDGLADGDLDEERAVGFVLRDPSGAVRVFPRGARWDAPLLFDDRTDAFGASPPGLALRTGGAIGPSELDREAAIAQLLAVRAPSPTPTGRGRRTYKERRLAPGDAITVVGRAMPFAMLADPAEADVDRGSVVAADDPEVLRTSPRRARRACWSTIRRRPGATRLSRASGSGAPFARRTCTPRRPRRRWPTPTPPTASDNASTSPRRRSSWPARRACRCSSPTVSRAPPSSDTRISS
jgi:hypothetical protein